MTAGRVTLSPLACEMLPVLAQPLFLDAESAPLFDTDIFSLATPTGWQRPRRYTRTSSRIARNEKTNSMNQMSAAQSPLKSPRTGTTGKLRWWIVWTLFLSTVTNYVSRQTFSILAPVITGQFRLSHTDLGRILGSFQISYALTWLLGGIVLDAVGTRIGLTLAAVFWSVVNMLTGLANSVFGFAAFRFLLGIGEGFNWPGANKTVAEWFPSQERSIAVAIFDSGSSVGGALGADSSAGRPRVWMARDLRLFRFAWFSMARTVAARLSLHRFPSPRLSCGGGLHPCRSGHAGRFPPRRHPALAPSRRRPQRVGHCAGPRPH